MRMFLFPLLFLLVAGVKSSGSERHEDGTPGYNDQVRISILSRHLKLVREGNGKNLEFMFDKPHEVYDLLTGNTFQTGYMNIIYDNSSWVIEMESARFTDNFNFTVKATEPETVAGIKIGGETRTYPLPLVISSSKGDPLVTVTESVLRYSADSAAAEYGSRPSAEMEALVALSRVIAARSLFNAKHPRHSGFNFCDLTHCQVYRGRYNIKGIHETGRLPFYGRWYIETGGMKNNLFFHSSCGGRTFGPEVFSGEVKDRSRGIKDILYRENRLLCRDGDSYWERRLDADNIIKILNPGNCSIRRGEKFLHYDKENMLVTLNCKGNRKVYSPENFRLRINRVMGWSYIRSNNYTVSSGGEGESAVLKGYGLGHGAGLCQKGALQLSRLGYSASEILQHYYRDIKLVSLTGEDDRSYNLSYVIFDLPSGNIISYTSPSLRERKFPPGSLWKLVTSLYLARERQDLLKDYTYTCTGKSRKEDHLPERCWKRGGHGKVNFVQALSGSCNLYFASLRKKIDIDMYIVFVKKLFLDLDIKSGIPEVHDKFQQGELLAGLDFRISLNVPDLIKIISLIQPHDLINSSLLKIRNKFPVSERNSIMEALNGTFIDGTASFTGARKKQPSHKKDPVFSSENRSTIFSRMDGMWGKTSTVIDGTNRPLSYGIFAGGYETKGVIVFLKDSNGHNAAKWGKIILLKE